MRRKLVGTLGVALLIAAAVGVAYPLWWQHRQTVVGTHEIRVLTHPTDTACTTPTPPGPGVLRIPAVSVVAPVVEGTSDAVLAVSVGHESSSPWPGSSGTAVLEAHDVGYFASNQLLRPGDVVTYTSGCRTYTYRVVAHYILRPGDTITPPGRSGLVLDSCWPTDALWFTPTRLIVTAVLTDIAKNKVAGSNPFATPQPPNLPGAVPTPPNLFNEGWLAGTLTFGGSPALAWKDGPGPLAWEGQGLRAFSALRMGKQTNASWISLLAPGVTIPSRIGGTYTSGTSVNVFEKVQGATVQSVTVTATIAGVPISITSAPVGGTLHVVAATP
ncbi:MAG: sortase domain-containing protein [Ferrimicrobium sp.]